MVTNIYINSVEKDTTRSSFCELLIFLLMNKLS